MAWATLRRGAIRWSLTLCARGVWRVASSVGSDESMAYCESSSRDPTSIPRTRWQVHQRAPQSS
jgi:hypothetical protein